MSKVFETRENCYKHSEDKYELRIDICFWRLTGYFG